METYLTNLLQQLNATLDSQSAERNVVIRYCNHTRTLKQALGQLKQFVLDHPFPTPTDEIRYFKEWAPIFYHQYFYYSKLSELEMFLSSVSRDQQLLNLQNEIDRVDKFYEANRHSALISLLMLFPTSAGSYQEEVKRRTHDLLKKGITKDNQDQAMELILAYESKYSPDKFVATTVEDKELKGRAFIISAVLFLLSSVRPKTTIGLGKKRKALRFYLVWWKFVVVTIPLTFIVNPLIEFIKSKI